MRRTRQLLSPLHSNYRPLRFGTCPIISPQSSHTTESFHTTQKGRHNIGGLPSVRGKCSAKGDTPERRSPRPPLSTLPRQRQRYPISTASQIHTSSRKSPGIKRVLCIIATESIKSCGQIRFFSWGARHPCACQGRERIDTELGPDRRVSAHDQTSRRRCCDG